MLNYAWLVENREFLKLVFNAVLFFICFIIVFKTHRMFKLSEHEGIRYFRNAFLFYGLAFVARYLMSMPFGFLMSIKIYSVSFIILKILYEFLFIMAGMFLFYSLISKRTGGKFSSLFNGQVFLLYTLALIISILDLIWAGYNVMFFSQIIIFSLAAGIALERYCENQESGFLGLYLMVILLMLVARILHFFASSFFEWNIMCMIVVYLLEILIFLLFLYGIFRITKN